MSGLQQGRDERASDIVDTIFAIGERFHIWSEVQDAYIAIRSNFGDSKIKALVLTGGYIAGHKTLSAFEYLVQKIGSKLYH